MAIWATIGAVPGWLIALWMVLVFPPVGLGLIVFLNLPGTFLLVRYYQIQRGKRPGTLAGPWWGTAAFNAALALLTLVAAADKGAAGLVPWAMVLVAITGFALDTAIRLVKRAREQEFAGALTQHGWE